MNRNNNRDATGTGFAYSARTNFGSHVSIALIAASIVVGIVSETSAGQTKTSVTARLSFTASPTHSGIIVAKAKGWYDAADLDVTVGEGTGSASTAQLVGAGHDTFGMVNADVAIRSISTGSPIKMVGMPVADSAYGIICRADTGIKTPADLAGHSFFENASSTSFIQAPLFLKKVGVPLDKFHMQSVSASTLVPGIMSGRYDCIGSLESQVSQYIIDGKPSVFFKFSDYGLPPDGITIVANTEYIASHPDVVRKFVQITDRGYDWAFDHPDEMYALMKGQFGNYAYNPKMTAAALVVFGALRKKDTGKKTGYIDEPSITALSSMLRIDFGVTNMPPASKLYTNEFVGTP